MDYNYIWMLWSLNGFYNTNYTKNQNKKETIKMRDILSFGLFLIITTIPVAILVLLDIVERKFGGK